MFEDLAPRVGLEPTTLRLTAARDQFTLLSLCLLYFPNFNDLRET